MPLKGNILVTILYFQIILSFFLNMKQIFLIYNNKRNALSVHRLALLQKGLPSQNLPVSKMPQWETKKVLRIFFRKLFYRF